ncbi:AMP-binding protein, partial [Streptomyces sp. NPDC057654]|uniref:AMP-binding protein n=1 Tax=Streptomyces sp. NPDC057654 TaxID=3346196 RepID=UPI0036C9E602
MCAEVNRGENERNTDWNSSTTRYPRNTPLHRLFEGQARRTPDAPSVDDGATSVTYRQLDRLANAVAWRLHQHGLSPGDRVGVMARLSADAVAALLGVLKAGGVYVPLDPSYPPARLAAMCEQADIRAAVVENPALGRSEPVPSAGIRVPMPSPDDDGMDRPPV